MTDSETIENIMEPMQPEEPPMQTDDEQEESESPPEPNQIRLTAVQFASTTKEPKRRVAGFIFDCERMHPGAKKTVSEWRIIWDTFWNTPIV